MFSAVDIYNYIFFPQYHLFEIKRLTLIRVQEWIPFTWRVRIRMTFPQQERDWGTCVLPNANYYFPWHFLWYYSFFPKIICHISFSYFNINLKSLYPQISSSRLRNLSLDHISPFYTISLADNFPFHDINSESLCIFTDVELFSQPRCNFSSQKIISPSSMPFLSRLGKYNPFLTLRTWKACTRPAVSSSAAPGTIIRRRSRKSRRCKPTSRLAEKSPIDSCRSCCCRSRSSIVPRSLRRRETKLLTMIRAQLRFPQWSATKSEVPVSKIAGSIPCAVSAQTERPLSGLTLPCTRRHTRVRARRVRHTCATLGTCAYTVTPKKNARVWPI